MIKHDINIGDVFSELTVINVYSSYIYKYKNKQQYKARWLCRCSCGNEVIAIGSHLRLKRATRCRSCGYKTRPQSIRRKTFIERLFDLSVNKPTRLRKRKISCELSLDDFVFLIKQNCYYCNAKPKEIDYIGNTKYTKMDSFPINGIDRVNSDIGYKIDNCVPCCRTCNVMKSNLKQNDFYEHLEKILKHCKDLDDRYKGDNQ